MNNIELALSRDFTGVVLPRQAGADIQPGCGITMLDPLLPSIRPFVPFESVSTIDIPSSELVSDDVANHAWNFRLMESVYEHTSRRALRFGMSYAGSSLSAAIQTTREEHKTSKFVWCELIMRSVGLRANFGSGVEWNDQIGLAEALSVPDECLRQVEANFGTHVITDLFYGAGLAIEAAFDSHSLEETKSVQAKLSSSFGAASASGSLSNTDRQFFEHKNLRISAAVVGDPVPANAQVLTSLEDVFAFIRKLRALEIRIKQIPESANVSRLWGFVDPKIHPNVRRALSAHIGEPAQAPFGVPSGTIVSWIPRKTDIEYQVPAAGEAPIPVGYRVPKGWALCDGATEGVPNLHGRFLRGSGDPGELGLLGGSSEDIEVGAAPSEGVLVFNKTLQGFQPLQAAAPAHTHKMKIQRDQILPLFATVALIIKL